MRLHLLTMGLAVSVCCCGGGESTASAPSPGTGGTAASVSIDGLWSTSSDGLGSTLAITLSSKGSGDMVVSGTGTYNVGAIRSGSLAVTGTYRAPSTALTITYDHGEVVTFAATITDADHMKGRLTYRSGSAIDVEFVRP